jgi:hypothetical protein
MIVCNGESGQAMENGPTTQCSRPVEPGFIAQGLVSPDASSRAADWERWALLCSTISV